MSEIMGTNLSKVTVSKSTEIYLPDQASSGAVSRWLESGNMRMRIVVYPSGYEADHVCYQGHAFYVVSGSYKIKIDEIITEWNEGDAFIIPDAIPHIASNPYEEEVKVIVFDNHV